MNSLVAVEIWFLSLIQISLYTLIIMFRISVARWTFTSCRLRLMTVASRLLRATLRRPRMPRAAA